MNAYSHDAGAALFVDGRLVFAAEEERYSRVRKTAAFPRGAIAAALAHAGLEPRDVACVAFPWRRDMARWRRLAYFLARFPRSLPFLFERPPGLPSRLGHLRAVRRLSRDLLSAGIAAPVRHVEHHLAHAVQAHTFSPFPSAAVLTMDGLGEWTAAASWLARDGATPRLLRRRGFPHSLGKVYAAVTQHLGFAPDADEGKTMGLAPYGAASRVAEFRKLVRASRSRLVSVDASAFAYPTGAAVLAGAPFAERFGPPREPESPLLPRHADLAFALQAVVEEVVLDVARALREETGERSLALAGGLFLNCALNGRLLRESGFDDVWAFPAAGDSGAAAGAAALVARASRVELRDALLGDAFPDARLEAALAGRAHDRAADPSAVAAEALAEGKSVGWFQGRMEFGPRALGARSILADPRDPRVKERLNRTVKFREDFRPFAPAVLEEAAGDWFVRARRSPFMLFTFPARPHARHAIPGVVHVDGTARVQTVAPGDGLFRRLLEAFAQRTGVPVVLNTSLNVRGEPIAHTPEEAVAVFDRTALDLLVLGPYVVRRSGG